MRAYFADSLLGLQNTTVASLNGASVLVVTEGTNTPVPFSTYTSETANTQANPLTADAQGKVEFWTALPQRVDLVINKTGFVTTRRTVNVILPTDTPGLTAVSADLNLFAGLATAGGSTGDVLTLDAQGKPVPAPSSGGSPTILRKAISYAVQASDSPGVLVATADDVVFTLPALADGLRYTFIDANGDTDHPMIVYPQSGERFVSGRSLYTNGEGLKASNGDTATPGSSLTVLGLAGVGWVVSISVYDWTTTPFVLADPA